jgi:hypothetical protein
MYYAEDEHQHAVVEVIMPEADPHAVSSSAASASSVTQDVASLIEKAIAKLPPDLQGQQSDVAIMDEDEDEDSGASAAGAPTEDGGGFRFNEDLLD